MAKKTGTVNIQEIATAAAIEALKIQKNDERMRIRKNRFHNTELLLKKYLNLIKHLEIAQDKASEEDLEAYNLDEDESGVDDVVIYAIRRGRMRTLIMVTQVEVSLAELRTKMIDKGQLEKYLVIDKLYLDPVKSLMPWKERVQTIAVELSCGEASVYRWKNDMIEDLSIMIFGVDGLRLAL